MLDPLLFIDMMSKFDQQEKARGQFVPPDITFEDAKNGRSNTGLSMSNFDHSIPNDMDIELINNPSLFGSHAGVNFHGTVWHEDGVFKEQVRRYGSIVDEIHAKDLPELMKLVNDKYGWE